MINDIWLTFPLSHLTFVACSIFLLYCLTMLGWSLSSNSSWVDTFLWVPLGNVLLVTLGCLPSKKVWWAVQFGSSCPKLRYFTDQNGPKEGPHKNEFWVFTNTNTVWAKKVHEKNTVTCLIPMFPFWHPRPQSIFKTLPWHRMISRKMFTWFDLSIVKQ